MTQTHCLTSIIRHGAPVKTGTKSSYTVSSGSYDFTGLWFNESQVADIFGVSQKAVSKWRIDPSEVTEGSKMYYLPDVCKYIRDRDDNKGLSLQDERALLAIEQRKKNKLEQESLKIEIDKKKGLLIPKEDLVDELSRIFLAMRSKMLALPRKHAPLLLAKKDGQEIEGILKSAIIEVLDELSSCKYLAEEAGK